MNVFYALYCIFNSYKFVSYFVPLPMANALLIKPAAFLIVFIGLAHSPCFVDNQSTLVGLFAIAWIHAFTLAVGAVIIWRKWFPIQEPPLKQPFLLPLDPNAGMS